MADVQNLKEMLKQLNDESDQIGKTIQEKVSEAAREQERQKRLAQFIDAVKQAQKKQDDATAQAKKSIDTVGKPLATYKDSDEFRLAAAAADLGDEKNRLLKKIADALANDPANADLASANKALAKSKDELTQARVESDKARMGVDAASGAVDAAVAVLQDAFNALKDAVSKAIKAKDQDPASTYFYKWLADQLLLDAKAKKDLADQKIGDFEGACQAYAQSIQVLDEKDKAFAAAVKDQSAKAKKVDEARAAALKKMQDALKPAPAAVDDDGNHGIVSN